MMLIVALAAAMPLMGDTETVGGYTWGGRGGGAVLLFRLRFDIIKRNR